MSFNDSLIFFFSPPLFFDFRIEMIMPSFAALFSDSTGQILSYITPIFRAMLENKFHDKFILLFCLK